MHATATQANQTETTLHFSKFWGAKTHHRDAIATALVDLADTLKGDLSKKSVLESYIAVLMPASPAQCIQAFSRALESCRFFPSPSELRDFASLPRADSLIKRDAMRSLGRIVEAIRHHTVDWQPAQGPILHDGRDPADGRVLPIPMRGPAVPAPVLEGHELDALRSIGGGTSVRAGLMRLSGMLDYQAEQAAGNGRFGADRDRARLEADWCEAYAQAVNA
jgi:hypothetical protein